MGELAELMGLNCYSELEIKAIAYECSKYRHFNKLFRRTKMIKLSNGVEISEDTVINALKKAGINVEPKHIFEKGVVAYSFDDGRKNKENWRFIIKINDELFSVDYFGYKRGNGTQEYFEWNQYKFAGKQSDLLKG